MKKDTVLGRLQRMVDDPEWSTYGTRDALTLVLRELLVSNARVAVLEEQVAELSKQLGRKAPRRLYYK